MERILVASTNPVKLKAVSEGFKEAFKGIGKEFEIQGISADSNVNNQPRTDEETYTGALNRVNNLSNAIADANYWVGIEGGICDYSNDLGVFAWVVIKSKDDKFGRGRTGVFMLPKGLSKLIREGMELGSADDIFFGRSNSKQKDGTVGKLTGGVIDRTRQYIDAVIYALIPFKNPDLY